MSRIFWKFLVVAAISATFFVLGCQRQPQAADLPKIDPSKYYAVLLSNNSVYFGKLEGFGTPYPILREVYYIQSSVNQETKAVSNVLIKRGKELHGPDMMIINEKSIVFVEPVGVSSKVAQLIQEAKNKGE